MVADIALQWLCNVASMAAALPCWLVIIWRMQRQPRRWKRTEMLPAGIGRCAQAWLHPQGCEDRGKHLGVPGTTLPLRKSFQSFRQCADFPFQHKAQKQACRRNPGPATCNEAVHHTNINLCCCCRIFAWTLLAQTKPSRSLTLASHAWLMVSRSRACGFHSSRAPPAPGVGMGCNCLTSSNRGVQHGPFFACNTGLGRLTSASCQLSWHCLG